MKKEIKSWLTGNVLYSAEAENIKELLMSFVKSGANLSDANLSGVNLSRAKFSYVLLMSSVRWGSVSTKLCLEMMRRDALITSVEAMSKWAKGGPCPFTSVSETRAYLFTENRNLWREGKPQMTDRELWVALCKEKNIKI